MRDFWQKLSIDWPCAVHDWLWQTLVVLPAAALDRLTRRQILHFLCVLLLLLLFQYTVAFDLSFLFGLDLGLILDVSAALMLLGARDGLLSLARTVRHRLSMAALYARRQWRYAARSRRTRSSRKSNLPEPGEDEGAVWVGMIYA